MAVHKWLKLLPGFMMQVMQFDNLQVLCEEVTNTVRVTAFIQTVF